MFGWRAQVIAAAILHPFHKAVGIEVRHIRVWKTSDRRVRDVDVALQKLSEKERV